MWRCDRSRIDAVETLATEGDRDAIARPFSIAGSPVKTSCVSTPEEKRSWVKNQ
ncbi:hypothetical protein POG22_20520 [Geitlerinema sp. CS-897]|nr:hypothetical protein [Geitlerinema sp. CS-897]